MKPIDALVIVPTIQINTITEEIIYIIIIAGNEAILL